MATTAAALLLLLLPDASALTCDSPELAGAVYCNHSLPIAARVEALVGQLTMAEKTAKVLESGGSVPRLGIPTLGSTECLRGYLSMFPQALTMSQAWNISLIHAVASATGDEVRASANEGSNGGNLSSGNAGGSLACFVSRARLDQKSVPRDSSDRLVVFLGPRTERLSRPAMGSLPGGLRRRPVAHRAARRAVPTPGNTHATIPH